jgi:hypothetical protein
MKISKLAVVFSAIAITTLAVACGGSMPEAEAPATPEAPAAPSADVPATPDAPEAPSAEAPAAPAP